MASSSGSSRGSLRLIFNRLRFAGAVLLAGLALPGLRAEMPGYLRAALASFNPGMPDGWAYTLTTVRNDRSMTERFDPAKPPAAQWTLLELEGRAPTDDETEKYARSRSAGPGGTQPNFERADIDPGSLTLVKEDDRQAEFTATFRETSAGPDKMLGHLTLRLIVEKRLPHVTTCVLELREPYSPVLSVKMNELRVETRFSPPTANRPSLPLEMTSRFAGRIFFISTGETLRLTYRDHAPSQMELSR